MHVANDERTQREAGSADPAQVYPRYADPEAGQDEADEARDDEQDAHSGPVPGRPSFHTPTAPLSAQRANEGACRCPRVTPLDCTCEWDELIAMITHLAYGADQSTVRSCAPAVAAMAYDVILSSSTKSFIS